MTHNDADSNSDSLSLPDDEDIIDSGILPRYCEQCNATQATRSKTGETHVQCCVCGHTWWPTATRRDDSPESTDRTTTD